MVSDIIHVPELAKMLGRSESAIWAARNRNPDWMPPHFKQGSRICWRVESVREFLREYESGAHQLNKESEMGEVMTRGIINMPLDMVMGSINGIENYHSTAQSLLADYDALRAKNAVLKTAYEETEKTLMSLYNLILPKLRAENAELVAALESIDTLVSEVIGADSGDRRILGKIEDEISAAIAKHRGE